MVLYPQTLFFSAHLFSTNYTHSIHSSTVARTLLVHNLNAKCVCARCVATDSLQLSHVCTILYLVCVAVATLVCILLGGWSCLPVLLQVFLQVCLPSSSSVESTAQR
jgi:hypothetical protein